MLLSIDQTLFMIQPNANSRNLYLVFKNFESLMFDTFAYKQHMIKLTCANVKQNILSHSTLQNNAWFHHARPNLLVWYGM